MFTVARAGQMGYQSRTEFNKRVLKISDKPEEINPKHGFINYGNIIGKYAIIQGTLPGPTKRCIAIRQSVRPERKKGVKLEAVNKVLVN
jgi:large subunit ribosomal protein L3